MLLNAIWIAWNPKPNQGENDDRSGSIHTGPASGAEVRKDGENWTLILVRELRHSPKKVWAALTEPETSCANGLLSMRMGVWVWPDQP